MKLLKSVLAASLVCVLGTQVIGCADMNAPQRTPLERHLGSIQEDKTIDQACATKIMQATIDDFGMKTAKRRRRVVSYARMDIRRDCRLKS